MIIFYLLLLSCFFFFFFKQKTAYEMRISDWSSDVCSSDLADRRLAGADSAIDLAAAEKGAARMGNDLQLAVRGLGDLLGELGRRLGMIVAGRIGQRHVPLLGRQRVAGRDAQPDGPSDPGNCDPGKGLGEALHSVVSLLGLRRGVTAHVLCFPGQWPPEIGQANG